MFFVVEGMTIIVTKTAGALCIGNHNREWSLPLLFQSALRACSRSEKSPSVRSVLPLSGTRSVRHRRSRGARATGGMGQAEWWS